MQTDIRYKIKWNIRGYSSSTWLNGMIIYRLIPGEMKSEKYVYETVKKYDGWPSFQLIFIYEAPKREHSFSIWRISIFIFKKKKKKDSIHV